MGSDLRNYLNYKANWQYLPVKLRLIVRFLGPKLRV